MKESTDNNIREYWQITRYYGSNDIINCGNSNSVLKYSYESAFKEYCDTLNNITSCVGDKLVLYHILDKFVTVELTTTIG